MKCILIFLFLSPFFLLGQSGGNNVFPFLNVPYNARAAALGGKYITVYDEDINMGIQNPAALNPTMDNSFGINEAIMAGGINHGMFAYAKHFDNVGTGAVHLRYVAYGKMVKRDAKGIKQGTFSPGDFDIGASLGRKIGKRLSIGATFHLIWSQLGPYSSMGFGIDFAGMYHSKDNQTIVSAVVRNIGAQLKVYHKKTRNPLPLQTLLGVSYKLSHAPFRFSLIAHDLHRWDLAYYDPKLKPEVDPLTGDTIPLEKEGFGKKLGRHFIVQVEANIGNIVYLRAAFNYNLRQELLVQNRPGMGGFSFGAGLEFKRFTIDYGLYIYSSAGMHNVLSLRTDIDSWKK